MSIRRCPHCNEILWERIPKTKRIYDFVRDYQKTTSRLVADSFDMSVQNAHNQLRKLCDAGLIRADYGNDPTGGVEILWRFP